MFSNNDGILMFGYEDKIITIRNKCLVRDISIFLWYKLLILLMEGTNLHKIKILGSFFAEHKFQVIYRRKTILHGIFCD